jgi:hypothetical protein
MDSEATWHLLHSFLNVGNSEGMFHVVFSSWLLRSVADVGHECRILVFRVHRIAPP